MSRCHHITAFLLILAAAARAQSGNIEFIENKGQWDQHVKYQSEVPGGSFFIRPGGFTILQHNEQDLKQIREIIHGHNSGTEKRKDLPVVLHSHAYTVDFAGASGNVEIVPDKLQSYYNNYFLGDDPSKWAGNCKIYLGVTLRNI